MAWITLLLSPSMINLENPASTANSRALRRASNSASLLIFTFSPLIVIVAMTSPLSFRITTPYPDLSKPEKIVASKFNLYTVDDGGCQTSPLCCFRVRTAKWTWACLNSSAYSFALLFRLLGSFNFPPCTT